VHPAEERLAIEIMESYDLQELRRNMVMAITRMQTTTRKPEGIRVHGNPCIVAAGRP
jgi:hypothetical protein